MRCFIVAVLALAWASAWAEPAVTVYVTREAKERLYVAVKYDARERLQPSEAARKLSADLELLISARFRPALTREFRPMDFRAGCEMTLRDWLDTAPDFQLHCEASPRYSGDPINPYNYLPKTTEDLVTKMYEWFSRNPAEGRLQKQTVRPL